MASGGIGMNAAGSANEASEIPDNVGDWLRGVYRFATDRNDFRRNLILNLGLFAAGGCSQKDTWNLPCTRTFQKQPPICDHHKIYPDGS
ncbi:Mitochondrial import receptor subunit TOM6 [Manis javanica]|nr:Mitochondrial import receptor subunit TOM6 [Manis javanica]